MLFRIVAAAVALLSAALGAPAEAAGLSPAQAEALLAGSRVPSVSIAQIRDGRIVFAAAYGAQSAGVPATPTTLYNLASLTKPIAAEAFLRLASKGGFRLDDPMSAYWLDPDIATDPRAAKLTPRLSLSHRTGFPNWRSKTSGLAFARDPGLYGYSGEGFVYLARYVARRTGTEIEPLVQSLVLDPAGMKDTAMTGRPWFEGRIAVPADAQGQPLKPYIATKANPADLAYSTAGDYARLLLQVMADKGLTLEIAAQRRTIQTDMKAETCAKFPPGACPDAVGFGLGWQVVEIGAERFLMHTGRDDGVATFAYVSPTHRTGLVILTNGDKGGDLFLPIVQALGEDPKFAAYLSALSR